MTRSTSGWPGGAGWPGNAGWPGGAEGKWGRPVIEAGHSTLGASGITRTISPMGGPMALPGPGPVLMDLHRADIALDQGASGGEHAMPLLDVFFTMMWFFLWILWIFLLVRVIMDIFRSRDMGGWAKAGWLVFTIVLPFLGVLVYLIARGRKMAERDVSEAQARDEAFRSYVRETVHENGSTADEITKLAGLRDHGVISEAEFQQGKEKVLSRPAA